MIVSTRWSRYLGSLSVIWTVTSSAVQPPTATAQSFSLETESSGLSVVSRTLGVSVADYDRDGDLDAYFVAQRQYDPLDPSSWNRLMRNEGDGTFMDVTIEAGAGSYLNGRPFGEMGYKFGAAWGDYDNDGYPDLYLTHFGHNLLLRNRGDGTFEDATASAGVAGDGETTHSSSVWWDYDRDNDLDLYVSAWKGKNRMFENRGDGTFEDITESSGLGSTTQTWTSVPIDGNNDGLPDIYTVDDFRAPNKFFLNKGDGTFVLATRDFGLENPGNGMGVSVGDYNNDGFFDIYLTNITGLKAFLGETNPLFTNNGNGFFENRAAVAGVDVAGWGWGNEFFDCDHDGDLDLYVANGFGMQGIVADTNNILFENGLDDGVFSDVSASAGADGWAHGFGLVVFDYDDDGDMDIIVSNNEEPPYLYRNTTDPATWLKVKLTTTVSNRSAYGAVVRVVVGDAAYHRQNDGVDFLGQSEQPIHFGLAGAEEIDRLIVEWPSGIVDVVEEVASNQTFEVVEGSSIATSESRDEIPDQPSLLGIFPNPSAHSVHVEVATAGQAVRMDVFDVSGRLVHSESRGSSSPGRLVLLWSGRDENGRSVSDGVYFLRISTDNGSITGKLVRVSPR